MVGHKRRRQNQHPSSVQGLTVDTSPPASISNLPSSIAPGATNTVTGTGIASAGPATTVQPTTYTVLLSTEVVIAPPVSGASTGVRSTIVSTIPVTDSASYAALTASPTTTSISKSTSSSSTSISAAHATSSASHKSSSGPSTALVVGIVVPVAVILIASFAGFWVFMRRRHRRALNRTSFVMTPKEKIPSTSPSSRSGPSMDGHSAPQKSSAVAATRAVAPSPEKTPPPEYTSPTGDILALAESADYPTKQPRGIPPRSDSAQGSRPSPRPEDRNRNFSSPNPDGRPGTGNSRRPPPNPSLQSRDRSNSIPGDRLGPSPVAGRGPPRPYPKGPGRDDDRHRQLPSPGPYRRAESPYGTSEHIYPPATRPGPRNFSAGPRPVPKEISPTNSTRAGPPAPINPPPVGAFNGAGSISQLSPIVKETPMKFKDPLPPIDTTDRSVSRNPRSPLSGSGQFSDENMRIAQLGTNFTSHSPELSPVNSSIAFPPRGDGATNSQSSHHRPRVSAVSAISVDDLPLRSPTGRHHDDDEDARSDVSSLHELDRSELGKFDFDNWGGDSQRASRADGRVSPIR